MRRGCIRLCFFAALLAGFLGLSAARVGAHHITRFAYTWMEVGKADVDGYRVTLIVKPPELSVRGPGEPKDLEREHEALSQFTHHFQAFVEDLRLREPVPYLDVTLSARMGNSRRDFSLRPRFAERGFQYAANVRLTRRGTYQLVLVLSPIRVPLSGLSKRREAYFRTRRVSFEFEFGYRSLKELMRDLFGEFAGLSGSLMPMGLPAPAKAAAYERVSERVRRLQRLAVLIPGLRFGEEQGRFLALAEDMGLKLRTLADSVERKSLDEAIAALAQARLACGACHRVFRDDDLK